MKKLKPRARQLGTHLDKTEELQGQVSEILANKATDSFKRRKFEAIQRTLGQFSEYYQSEEAER